MILLVSVLLASFTLWLYTPRLILSSTRGGAPCTPYFQEVIWCLRFSRSLQSYLSRDCGSWAWQPEIKTSTINSSHGSAYRKIKRPLCPNPMVGCRQRPTASSSGFYGSQPFVYCTSWYRDFFASQIWQIWVPYPQNNMAYTSEVDNFWITPPPFTAFNNCDLTPVILIFNRVWPFWFRSFGSAFGSICHRPLLFSFIFY